MGENNWHLDKRVPIVLVLTIFLQTVGIGIWIGSIGQRVTSLEQSATYSRDNQNRIVRLEATAEGQSESLRRIEQKLDRLIEREAE